MKRLRRRWKGRKDYRVEVTDRSGWVVVGSLLGSSLLVFFLSPAPQAVPVNSLSDCRLGNAQSAADRLKCIPAQQLDRVLSFQFDPDNDAELRQALGAAVQISHCMNDPKLFPDERDRVSDFLCLQETLLNFYDKIPTELLYYDDRLARGSFRAHHCIFPTEIVDSSALENPRDCFNLVGEALVDYQHVFEAAQQIKSSPGAYSSAYLAGSLGMDFKDPAPDFYELRRMIDLAVSVAHRYPELGMELAATLGPTLCDAWQLYPARRMEVSNVYNLLIRLDGGDLSAPAVIHMFLTRLNDTFPLQTIDWGSSPRPCEPDEGSLVFPELRSRPGRTLTDLRDLKLQLEKLMEMLCRAGDQFRTHENTWKPFHRFGELLYRQAQSLGTRSQHYREAMEIRQLLIDTSKDAYLQGVKYFVQLGSDADNPQLAAMRQSMTTEIQDFGNQLYKELEFGELQQFARSYLETESDLKTETALLSQYQRRLLHRWLAIALFMQNDQSGALMHVQESDISESDLIKLKESLSKMGVGVHARP